MKTYIVLYSIAKNIKVYDRITAPSAKEAAQSVFPGFDVLRVTGHYMKSVALIIQEDNGKGSKTFKYRIA